MELHLKIEIVHKFEKAGLGIAPFRVTDYFEMKYQACPGAPIQPGTCCDYCGTGIMYVYQITDSTGKTFRVGSDCVRKTGDDGLIRRVSEQEAKIRGIKRESQFKRDQERIKKAQDLFPAVCTKLESEPHPMNWPGKTLADYVEFLLFKAGNSGRLRAAKIIEKAKD